MGWEIDFSFIEDWLDEQDEDTVNSVFACFRTLGRVGPSLGRPLVDSLSRTKIKGLKELRVPSGKRGVVRILFIFDPWRKAVMLLAGDKSTGSSSRLKWSGWYRRNIPKAEERYRVYLQMKEVER